MERRIEGRRGKEKAGEALKYATALWEGSE
jgi:hypothetical protein